MKVKRSRKKQAEAGQPTSTQHIPSTGFFNGASTLKQYFVFALELSEHYLMYTLEASRVLGISDPQHIIHVHSRPQDLGEGSH